MPICYTLFYSEEKLIFINNNIKVLKSIKFSEFIPFSLSDRLFNGSFAKNIENIKKCYSLAIIGIKQLEMTLDGEGLRRLTNWPF